MGTAYLKPILKASLPSQFRRIHLELARGHPNAIRRRLHYHAPLDQMVGSIRPSLPDEIGFHLADERFVTGEHVLINENGKRHAYCVVSVSHL